MYRLKANTVKLMINSFANGDLELVRKFFFQYGKEVFDYTPRIKSGNFSRLIFYSFKNGHFEVINFYLSVIPEAKISDGEIRAIANHIAHRDRFSNWFSYYEYSESLKSKINSDLIFSYISSYVISSYDIELIDQFLDRFPDKFQDVVKQCSTSAKGIQLKRHLKLRELL